MEPGAHFQQAADAAVEVHRPSVGSVIRERIFSSVDLPAPFRPMMPTTSPGFTSKLTSLSAQIDLRVGSAVPIPAERSPEAIDGRNGSWTSDSRRVA